MELEMIQKFIMEGYAVFVVALWIIGALLKRTPNVADWLIIWILIALGIAFAVAYSVITNGLVALFILEGIVQGILVAGSAILGHQLIKQTKDKRNV